MLLRALVGVVSILAGADSLTSTGAENLVAGAVGMLAVMSGGLVLLGFLTPGTAVVAAVSLVVLSTFDSPASFLEPAAALYVAAVAVALVLLGPGAVSIDAHLFGRREIVFSHDSHEPRS